MDSHSSPSLGLSLSTISPDKGKMTHVDTKFSNEMCYDMCAESQRLETSVASIHTRNIVYSPDHHTVYPTIDFPEEFRIDTKPFVNRPFFIENVAWGNQTQYSFLTHNVNHLPRDVFKSNLSLSNALKLGAYFRSDLTLNISVAGTISHAGTILAAVLPPFPNTFISPSPALINSMLSGPHCFLHANEATSCVLHVPWYCNTDVASLDMDPTAPGVETAIHESLKPGQFATLALFVLNPLQPSQGSSSSVNIVIEACFNALDIFVPSPKFITYQPQGISEEDEELLIKCCHSLMSSKIDPVYTQGLQSIASAAIDASTSYAKKMTGDIFDVIREGIRYYTGLHNPNIPLLHNRMIVGHRNFGNNTTGEQFFEKLDPYPEIDRIVDRPIFNTIVDEMSIRHILSKPQYIASFNVASTDNTGKILFSRPISPFQGGFMAAGVANRSANNIELLHRISRAWRGSLKIHIQSVMNNKQQVKLRMIQLYNPSTEVLSGFPRYQDILSAPSHLMEFTAGGQIQTVELPYLCRNNLTPCSRDPSVEGLFHGMYYIYVAQPLVYSTDSPLNVSFNVYISGGDNLTFHGYATEPTQVDPFVVPPASGLNKILDLLGTEDVPDNRDEEYIQALSSQVKYVVQGLDVMNEPQQNTALLEQSNGIDVNIPHQERLFSPIDLRSHMRRFYQTSSFALNPTATVVELTGLIGEFVSGVPKSPFGLVTAMYYGKSPGLKIKIKLRSTPGADEDIQILFMPPNINVNTTNRSLRKCVAQPEIQFSPTVGGSTGYPLPLLEWHTDVASNTRLAEFVIPNTSYYKFIGGPQKFANAFPDLSTADFGSLVIYGKALVDCTIYCCFTDETRLGFHSIAPIFRAVSSEYGSYLDATIYAGATGGAQSAKPSRILNSYIYYTRT